MRLRSRIKCAENRDGFLSRVTSVDNTLTAVMPVCKEIGVTRISDITLLDRLYIPNYSTTLPGTDDIFWVYGGKGTTKTQAKVSALMESVERYSSMQRTNPNTVITDNYTQLSKSFNKVLHPSEVIEPLDPNYNEGSTIDFLRGFDLLNDEEILVPAEIVYYRYFPERPAVSAFQCSHTNGLASGNVLEEAICHALCEVIERDAVSIADLCASSIPYNIVHNIGENFEGISCIDSQLLDHIGANFVDEPTIYLDVEIDDLVREFPPIRKLLRKFTDARIPLMIKCITQEDINIPTIAASSVDWISHDYGLFAKGYGTHLDSRVALMRAITELAQTRAANIQGARDDLKRIQYKDTDEIYKRKWPFMPSSYLTGQNRQHNIINFRDIKTYVNNDILSDINLILSILREAGITRVIIVELTNPKIGIPVVRAIVPGLETFEVTHSVMGTRAKKHFNKHFPCIYK
jgi:ribosomal protein S12 methylthiotransferase accessory factor YcaO